MAKFTTLKIVKILFASVIIIFLYVFCQTTLNYVYVAEALVHCKANYQTVRMVNLTDGWQFEVIVAISNPSHLEINVYLVEQHLFAYNKSSFTKDKFEQMQYSKFAFYNGGGVIQPNSVKYLNVSFNITDNYPVSKLKWLINHQADLKTDLFTSVFYKVVPFEYKKAIYLGVWHGEGPRYGYG